MPTPNSIILAVADRSIESHSGAWENHSRGTLSQPHSIGAEIEMLKGKERGHGRRNMGSECPPHHPGGAS